MKTEYYYSVEMFRNGQWGTDIRTYYFEKNINDSDLCDVEGKRRNAKELTFEEYYQQKLVGKNGQGK